MTTTRTVVVLAVFQNQRIFDAENGMDSIEGAWNPGTRPCLLPASFMKKAAAAVEVVAVAARKQQYALLFITAELPFRRNIMINGLDRMIDSHLTSIVESGRLSPPSSLIPKEALLNADGMTWRFQIQTFEGPSTGRLPTTSPRSQKHPCS